MLNFLRLISLAILFSNLIYAGSVFNFSNNFTDKNFDSNKPQKFSPADTSKTSDTLKTVVKKSADSLAFIEPERLDDSGISGKLFTAGDIKYSDYRYTGNFFTYLPFGMLKDLGQTGQPSEASVYGLGYNNVTFMYDGLVLNDRLQNSFDTYNLPDLNLKYIEVIPLARGFLYGTFSNAAAVNFIPDNTIRSGAYSRIRYYQAPNSEGYFSGDFKTKVSRRIGLGINLTNHSADPLYDNSGFSHWNGGISFIYLLSDKFNLRADYNYLQNNIQLNGGVDADSISRAYSSAEFDNILYNTISAPVRFSDRYMKNTAHNFTARLLGEIFGGWRSDVSVYYRTNLQEFRQNEANYNLGYDSLSYISNNNKYSTFGAMWRQIMNLTFASLDVIANYEHAEFNSGLFSSGLARNSISISGKLSLANQESLFHPSVFGKYLIYSGNNYAGAGADVLINFSDNLDLYAGVSIFRKPASIFEESFHYGSQSKNGGQIKNIEVAVSYRNPLIDISLAYIHNSSDSYPLTVLLNTPPLKQDNIVYTGYNSVDLNSANLNFVFRLWKLDFTGNSTYYFDGSGRTNYSLPEFTAEGGVYYIDTLFSSNLSLKTGLRCKFYGSRNYTIIDFQKSLSAADYITVPVWSSSLPREETRFSNSPIPASGQIDFFLAGTIQKNATIYFVFENLLDTRYYISSYYPMPGRGIRLGVTWEFFD